MLIFLILEISFIIIGLYLLLSQILIPIFKGTPMFPGFRKAKAEVQEDIEEIKELLEVVELEKEKKKLEAKLPTHEDDI